MALLPDECGGDVLERRPERSWILIDPRLSPVEQRCRLAHALVHLDRGSMRCSASPAAWDSVVAREEDRVDAEVAAWLLPIDELWTLVHDLTAEGTDVTARVVAAEFQVTKPIARIALDGLAERGLRVA